MYDNISNENKTKTILLNFIPLFFHMKNINSLEYISLNRIFSIFFYIFNYKFNMCIYVIIFNTSLIKLRK